MNQFFVDTIDPRYCTLQEWTDAMKYPLSNNADVPRLDNSTDPEGWKGWANDVIQGSNRTFRNPPDPRFYDDWRIWAFDFTKVTS